MSTKQPEALRLAEWLDRYPRPWPEFDEAAALQPAAAQPQPLDGHAPLPERDTTKPAEQQGLFRKFVVQRTDGSDANGGKHHGCEYFVLDVDHDDHAKAALAAYAASVAATHPKLAADMRERYDLPSQTAAPARAVEPKGDK